MTPTVNPGSGVSINAGGSATGSFTADQYFSGGSTYTNTATIDMSQIPTNPPPAAIFNTERYGAMTYTIPNRSGAQTVTLYFAETYVTAAGQRLFNVSINGTTVLSSFDIYASAGGANRAIARTFNTTANTSGQVVIQFIAGTENPKINGITVASGSVSSFTLTVSKTGSGSGTVTSNPAGINCGSTCSASYANDTSVTLTAVGSQRLDLRRLERRLLRHRELHRLHDHEPVGHCHLQRRHDVHPSFDVQVDLDGLAREPEIGMGLAQGLHQRRLQRPAPRLRDDSRHRNDLGFDEL